MEQTSFFKQSSFTNQTEPTVALTSNMCAQVDGSPYVFVLGYSLVFVVGLVLNVCTIRFYLCQAQQETSSRMMVYLKNLTAADFLICLTLPLYIANYSSNSITIRSIYCNVGPAIFYVNMWASILFLSCIAANRYVQIVRPSGTPALQSVRTAHVFSAVTWGSVLLVGSVFVTLIIVNRDPLKSALDGCDVDLSAHTLVLYKVLYTFTSTMFFFVLVSLLFFYHGISRTVSLAQQNQLASSNSTILVRSRRNMLVLVTVFCVCFIPFHLVRLPYVFLWTNCPVNHVFYYLVELSRFMSVLNICLDPVLYIMLCESFRSQLKQMMLFRAVTLMMQRLNRNNLHVNTVSVNGAAVTQVTHRPEVC
ncbi:P2Y purinoceptor 14-like [Betta splendens]|uniref:P2Y purinoceptor 14-like n=1 Tax=Betta splendens TaxID=158456 RepID=A0A9W2Y807_BETSP|nr:P2Y purinoceptor 14-like [Betta splendens]